MLPNEEKMKINLLFPGQGSQFEGMGLDFYKKYNLYQNIIDEAGLVSGMDLCSILGDAGRLNETENAQIAIFTMSYGIASLLSAEGIEVSNVLGLSLGEYGALTHSGVLKRTDTVKLLKRRSSLMQMAAKEREGFLAAVSFMDREEVLKAISGLEGVSISNCNAPNQNVVGGDLAMKEEFDRRIREQGGKKITYLNVSGAFHTPLMEKAGILFGEYLSHFSFSLPSISVLSNLKGDYYQEGDHVPTLLTEHIFRPVQLDSCIGRLEAREEDVHIVLGPGKALASILKQNKTEGKVITINDVEEFENAVKLLKERQNG